MQEGVFYLDDGVGGPFSYKELLADVFYRRFNLERGGNL